MSLFSWIWAGILGAGVVIETVALKQRAPGKPTGTFSEFCRWLAGTNTNVAGRTSGQGYGWRHQQERERWRPEVEAGLADCWRCVKPIRPWEPWDLGHDDDDPTKQTYRGPEHRGCNRRAGGEKAARRRGWAWRPRPRRERVHPELSVDPTDL
jgi:hypothetical protein